ncbi:hypothetical protein D3C85_1162170 [compost metagenome]
MARRGQCVDHRHQGQRGGGDGQQVLPLAMLEKKGVDQRQGPGREERTRLPELAPRQIHGQQPVGQEKPGHAKHHARDGAGVQAINQPQRKCFTRILRTRLLAPLGNPQHQPRAHHAGARQTDQEIEPAQQRFGEKAQVQAGDGAGGACGSTERVLAL